MKTTPCLIAALALGLLSPVSCRQAEDQPGPTPVYYGVKVDLPKLETAFANTSPELQASAAAVKQYLRYAQLTQALAELGNLAANPALTETQKTVVHTLIEQTRKVIANSNPTPGQ